jgi:thiol-disulfide isomerase/thioredoxin
VTVPMGRWIKLGLVGLVALLLAEVLLRSPEHHPAEGQPAPPLSLRRLDGTPLDLAALRGTVVAVNFWATWCAPCRAELPELAAARQDAQGRCLEVVGVAEESAREDVAEVARRLPYPVVVDPRAGAAAAWGVTAYPRTYLVDREGRVNTVFFGALDRQRLLAAAAPLQDPACRGRAP